MLWGSRQRFTTKYIYNQQNVNRLYCYIYKTLNSLVIHLLENCQRLYFSVEESYVYYEFIKLY